MKTKHAWILYTALAGLVGSTGEAAQADARQPQVVERGPHHRKWEHVVTSTDPDGRTVAKTNRYTELATGMHYWKDGQWAESREVIDIVPGGALASQGQHQVGFAANINTVGAINMLTADGKRLRSHVLGLAYTDAQTGQSVMIAEVKDSIGELVGENQIIYRDAFTELKADIRYTYMLSGLEQDIIMRDVPPDPGTYGLNPGTTRLEVFTEFIEAPEPGVAQVTLSTTEDPAQRSGMASPDFIDQRLDFGAMGMSGGNAFPIGDDREANDASVPTGKTWEKREGRTFLIEAVQYPAVKSYLEALTSPPVKKEAKLVPKTGPGRSFPPPPKQAMRNTEKIRMASLPWKQNGFVIDYSLVSSATNFTFRGDTTYFLSGVLVMSGTTVFEGGAVLKYTNRTSGPRLDLKSPVDFRTSPYRPVVFTAKDDDTMGDTISGSTGTPSGFYADLALLLDSTTNFFAISNIVIRHAQEGVSGNHGVKYSVENGQYHKCTVANRSSGDNVWRNCLVTECRFAILLSQNYTNYAEHLTVCSNESIGSITFGALYLTNCLLVANTNVGNFTGGANIYSNTSFASVFQTVGSGRFYLKDDTYRNLGTTNISSQVLALLRQGTTYPPVVLSNTTTAVDLTLAPTVWRDTDVPDVGYHYAALDYYVSGLTVTNATLTLTNGVAVGIDYSAGSWGVIQKSAKVVSAGSPTSLNRIVRAHMVQEKSSGNPGTRALFYDGASADASNQLRMRFTYFAQLAGDGDMLSTGQKFSALEWTHSALYNSTVVIDADGANTLACGLTNTLWERGSGKFGLTNGSASSTIHARNNLFRNFTQHFIGAESGWSVKDNLVDGGGLDDHGVAITNAYNAYYLATTNLSGGYSNLTLGSLAYLVGPLGNYYQPSNSILINGGSQNATNAGLYHFTCTTNQFKETNSVVDIGLHYVALNASGNPQDYDGDGVPDYFEDWNGNGAVDSGETDWKSASDLGFRIYITRPKNNSVIP